MIDRLELLNLCDFDEDEMYGIIINNVLYCMLSCSTTAFYILLELFSDFQIPDKVPPHEEDRCYGQGWNCQTKGYYAGGGDWDAARFHEFVLQSAPGMLISVDKMYLPKIEDDILEENFFPAGIPRVFLTKKDIERKLC